ncbi:MAG: hypothetical protein K5864_06500 [Bacteroidales bacterium]|nr:hypothetical protein [Bacteroidales bacterium]
MHKVFSGAMVLAVLVGCSMTARAQVDSNTYHESVIVVGDYNPVLDGVTDKVNVAPAINDNLSEEMKPHFTYSITSKFLTPETKTTGLKTVKLQAAPTKLYNNYMRFGLGHDFAAFGDFTPLADLYYTSTRKDNMAYGVRLFHQTDWTTYRSKSDDAYPADGYGSNRQSITRFDIFGKYILKNKHLFSGDLSFDRMYDRYYGFSDSVAYAMEGCRHNDIDKSRYALTYNDFTLNLGAKSLQIDEGKLGYEANMGLDHLGGRWDFSEMRTELDANVHYGFPMFQKYKAIAYLRMDWTHYRQRFDKPGSVDDVPGGFVGTLPDSVDAKRHLLIVNPYVDFLMGGFLCHAGLAMGFNGYDSISSTSHNLFADIMLSKAFRNNNMNLSFGFQGGYEPNDWNHLRLNNPYLAPAPRTLTTVDNNLFAHLRINFSKKLILNLKADNHFYKHYAFYYLDKQQYSWGNVFNVDYQDVKMLNLGADFTFVNDEMIKTTLGGDLFLTYGLKDGAAPLLYLPLFTMHLDVEMNYHDKWFFGFNSLLITKMDADYTYNPVTGICVVSETIPFRFGLDAHVEYRYNRALSFFAKFDNLTCQRYYIWAHYPSSRLNMMLGLTYTFPNSRKR